MACLAIVGLKISTTANILKEYMFLGMTAIIGYWRLWQAIQFCCGPLLAMLGNLMPVYILHCFGLHWCLGSSR